MPHLFKNYSIAVRFCSMSCDRHMKKSTYPIERKWNNSRMVPTVVEEDGDAQHFFPRVSSVVWSMPESNVVLLKNVI